MNEPLKLKAGVKAFDKRGYFMEVARLGVMEGVWFAQYNQSSSKKGVLRGLHLDIGGKQVKWVRPVTGYLFYVAVDCRKDSPTFGDAWTATLDAEFGDSFLIPGGFASGFMTVHGPSVMVYQTTEPWRPNREVVLRYDDPKVGIEWPEPVDETLMSDKDLNGRTLDEILVHKPAS